jgi:dihydroorotate dehydrogenase (NAD+) catalytic subunit
MAIDTLKRRPVLGNTFGGLSGPAIKPLALALVYRAYGAVKVPIIGCGGIASANDAFEFLMAGASALQVGTSTFTDPRTMADIVEGLERFMEREGISDIREIVGAAHGQ